MATQSFFRNIVINDKESAKSFIKAMEKSANRKKKKISKVDVRNVTDREEIKKMFKE